jgi:hypothetical protein
MLYCHAGVIKSSIIELKVEEAQREVSAKKS